MVNSFCAYRPSASPSSEPAKGDVFFSSVELLSLGFRGSEATHFSFFRRSPMSRKLIPFLTCHRGEVPPSGPLAGLAVSRHSRPREMRFYLFPRPPPSMPLPRIKLTSATSIPFGSYRPRVHYPRLLPPGWRPLFLEKAFFSLEQSTRCGLFFLLSPEDLSA